MSTTDWVEEACRRALYLRRLFESASRDSSAPSWQSAHPSSLSVLDLSALCRPEGFLLAMYVFMTEEVEAVPPIGSEAVMMHAQVTPYEFEDDLLEPRKDGVYLAGVFMVGGIWDAANHTMLPHPTGSCMPLIFVSLEADVSTIFRLAVGGLQPQRSLSLVGAAPLMHISTKHAVAHSTRLVDRSDAA